MSSTLNILLVHGAFTDGSSWSKIIPRLQAAGHHVAAVQLGLAALAADVTATRLVLDKQDGPTLLVGHSYGGAVISGAGAGASNAIGLVYVAGYAPDAGERLLDAIADIGPAEGAAHLVPDYQPGFVRLDPDAYPVSFMHDADPVEARTLAVTQKPIATAIQDETAGPPAWRSLPAWYLVCEEDRMIHPDAQCLLAKRMNAVTRVVRCGHAAHVSRSAEVGEAILAAARAGRPA
jgi:pimeloyl-ACP methyl ester carboxylesterase